MAGINVANTELVYVTARKIVGQVSEKEEHTVSVEAERFQIKLPDNGK
jgi:hypothetical protein